MPTLNEIRTDPSLVTQLSGGCGFAAMRSHSVAV